jgi:tetratricopeptide (TPR) repeat protein
MAKTKVQNGFRISPAVRWMFFAVLILISAFFAWPKSSVPIDQLLQDARRSWQRAEFEAALLSTESILQREPENPDALWISGRSHARLKQYTEAVRDLHLIDLDSAAGIDSRLLIAEILHYHLYLFDEAEQAYRAVLRQNPVNAAANDGLARLLSVCGRRSEAIPLILRLVQLQQASDLLMVPARESGAINDEELLTRAHQAAPDSAGPLLGLARLADLRQQTDEAVTLCQRAVEKSPQSVTAHSELGRYLLQLQPHEKLNDWRRNLPPDAMSSAEIQTLIGFVELRNGHRTKALNLFLSAAKSQPDSRNLCHQISQLLFAAGDSDSAKLYVDQMETIRQLYDAQDAVLFSSGQASPESTLELIAAYQRCGRLLEAYGWAQLAVQRFPENAVLRQLSVRLAKETAALPPALVPESVNPAFVVSLNRYEIEDIVRWGPNSTLKHPGTASDLNEPIATGISFSATSAELGLNFTYVNGGELKQRMLEFGGGGVGCDDLDGDGYPEIVFSQGGDWYRRGTPDNQSDALFRNLQGESFREVSQVASFGSTDFGQGVAIGDIDQDGLPDVVIASIGGAKLWRNLGDGTFQETGQSVIPRTPEEPWLTSCAIADLNEDSFPDIYLAGYLSGADVFERVCMDSERTSRVCQPTAFMAEMDYLLLNDGVGGFVDSSNLLPASVAEGKGLGVLVFSPGESGSPGIYVANDTTPNSLLIREANNDIWTDTAFTSGVAVSYQGKPEGSMGIALGDADGDGHSDLVVTNFLNEGSAFYQSLGESAFRDERSESGLEKASAGVLGFGVQFLDANLDGNPEMFVSNGHVDDLERQGKPFKMPAQLFTMRDRLFRVLQSDDLGPYFQRNHLGRAVAKTDWNVDGKPDLVLGNLLEPSLVLTNTSQSSGKSLQLRLISLKSNRGAICASVTCQAGKHRQVQQLTAGDGYQCSNEKLITFGIAGTDFADVISISWPSGEIQQFHNIAVPNRVIVIEGRATAFTSPQ